MYSVNRNDNDITSVQDISFTMDDDLFLEILLMQIRGECISYASYDKKMKDDREKQLMREINELEDCDTQENQMSVFEKTELQIPRSEIISFIRSKSCWIDSAEKPSAFFSVWKRGRLLKRLLVRLSPWMVPLLMIIKIF